ncbi:MAG: glycosyltransferase family 4 protein [Deltaproteobacteria bacterium]|nr:glycosyltransferase family 4 protein [Deltaproteobacteria bacterium]
MSGAPRATRVLVLDHARELGGAEVAVVTALAGLGRDRFDVTIAAPEGGAFAAAVRRAGLEFAALPLDRVSPRRPLAARRALAELRALAAVARPDVVLVNGVRALKACLALGGPGAVPVVAFVHDVLEPGVVSPWMARARLFRERVERFLVPTGAAVAGLVAHGIEPARVTVVPPAVEAVAPLAAAARGEARRAIGVAADATLVGYVGQLEERKGVDVLLDALDRADLGAGGEAVIVGDDPFGEHAAYRERILDRARGQPRVRITGWRWDAPRLIAALDVLVCPSRRDACPLTVLQAMSAGVAVIGTRVGGIPEQLGGGAAGVLVPPDDAAALAAALERLAGDAAARASLGAAARERHRAHYALELARAGLAAALAGAAARD